MAFTGAAWGPAPHAAAMAAPDGPGRAGRDSGRKPTVVVSAPVPVEGRGRGMRRRVRIGPGAPGRPLPWTVQPCGPAGDRIPAVAWTITAESTITPPVRVKRVGSSPTPIHTQMGASTISDSERSATSAAGR